MESPKQIHTDAPSLITYRSAEGKLEEQIWNGRNRAAPFVVDARDAETPLPSVNSEVSESSASQQPNAGDRIFADATMESMIARKRRMVESEWKNPEFQRIVVKSLVRKLGDNPSPLLIAQHLAECEFERHRSPGIRLIMVSDSVPERLRRERLQSPPV
jgi:hypothetical protein